MSQDSIYCNQLKINNNKIIANKECFIFGADPLVGNFAFTFEYGWDMNETEEWSMIGILDIENITQFNL